MQKIQYREGYKYQLATDYSVVTPIRQNMFIEEDWFCLNPNGKLTIRKGYAWDGASGPTIDTKSSMRPSLIHDCFCQMMREEHLSYSTFSKQIHSYFKQLCIEDGMHPWRAQIWYWGVLIGKGGQPEAGEYNPIIEAPE